MPKVTIEFEVEIVQELAFYLEKKVNQIDWVLENKSPKNEIELDGQAKGLTKIAATIKDALNARALENKDKVVKLNGKK